jgi:hypothetical protein
MLWVVNAARPGFESLGSPGRGTLVLGQILGVTTIPLYTLGYAVAAQGLTSRMMASLVLVGGAIAACVGGAAHGITGAVVGSGLDAGSLGADPFAVMEPLAPYIVPVFFVVGLAGIAASGGFVFAVSTGRSNYPRWVALTSPFPVAVALSILVQPFRYGEAFLIPMSANLSQIPFFAVLLWFSRKIQQR